MIPKRKPIPGNRKARRAEGVKLIKPKRGGGGGGGPSLAEALKRVIADNDPSVVMSAGLMLGEKGWLFHRQGRFAYAVTSGKGVTLHAVALHGDIHADFKKRIPMGEFGKGLIKFKPDAKVDLNVIAALVQACVIGGLDG
jgi:hypothetical protein